MLADEMTSELRSILAKASEEAASDSQEVTLLSADFDSDFGGFEFIDDIFSTSNPEYSRGSFSQPRGGTHRAVTTLGGRNNREVLGMSGGWQSSFYLSTETEVKISFNYRLKQTANYESNEISQARIKIDDEEIILAEFEGDEDGGSSKNSGIQDVELTINLAAGDYRIILGAYNNKKDARNEKTFVSYDNVVIIGRRNEPGPVTKKLVAKGVEFGSITVMPDGTVDRSRVEGVNRDLRIRPFFAEGGLFLFGNLLLVPSMRKWDLKLLIQLPPPHPWGMPK